MTRRFCCRWQSRFSTPGKTRRPKHSTACTYMAHDAVPVEHMPTDRGEPNKKIIRHPTQTNGYLHIIPGTIGVAWPSWCTPIEYEEGCSCYDTRCSRGKPTSASASLPDWARRSVALYSRVRSIIVVYGMRLEYKATERRAQSGREAEADVGLPREHRVS